MADSSEAKIRSMTGFGRAEGNIGSLRASVEVSSLNHRNREMQVFLPPRWSRLDPSVRRAVAKSVRRGKVRVAVRIPDEDGAGLSRFVYRPEVVEIYQEAYADLQVRLGDGPPLTASELLKARGVVCPVEVGIGELSPEEGPALEALLGEALEALVASRVEEGAALRRDLEERLAEIEVLSGRIRDLLPGVKQQLQDRFRSRIQDLMQGQSMPEERLLAEAALYVDRADVHEELVRLKAHQANFAAALIEGGAQGRKLAFMGQELNRESNTLGAKSQDPECSRLVVLLKDEVAKIREQVENLE